MTILEEQGLLFSYISLSNDWERNQLNHLLTTPNGFFNSIRKNTKDISSHLIDIFCITGTTAKIQKVQEKISPFLNTLQNRKLKKKDIIEDNICIESFIKTILYISSTKKINFSIQTIEYDDISYITFTFFQVPINIQSKLLNDCLELWHDDQKIFLAGKQVLTEELLLRELNGRRIISTKLNPNNDERFLLLEGGITLNLRERLPYQRETFGIYNSNIWSLHSISEIISNPIYALKKYYMPNELFYIWQKIFTYALIIENIKLDIESLRRINNRFLDFIESEICEIMTANPIIDEDTYYKSFLKIILTYKKYLKGKGNDYLSKDYLILLKNYCSFLTPMKYLINQEYKNNKQIVEFDKKKYDQLYKDTLTANTNYTKGTTLEQVMEYLIKKTKELKVTAKRAKTDREEIDIICCNISNDSKLWELGALILVECKNWKRKIDVNIMRRMGYIMSYKGCNATILVTKTGTTKYTKKEQEKLAIIGRYVIIFTLNELKNITPDKFIDKIKIKYQKLKNTIKNDQGLYGD